jgi:putative ABC transport system ATP-binding protein
LNEGKPGNLRAPGLTIADLQVRYSNGAGAVTALEIEQLSVPSGAQLAVTGPSGSGKSTLLACLAGLDEPDGGMVRVAGERLSRRPEEDRARVRARRIGMLFQQANLVGHLSVADNMALAQRLAGSTTTTPAGWREQVLERCGITARAHARPSQLSGGELARAGLAVALANDPDVLLADEPTGELDSVTARRVLEMLHDRAAEGAAVLIVTHSPEVAAMADREIRLRDGRVEA